MQESKKQNKKNSNNAPELWNFFGNDLGQIFYDIPKDVTLSIFSNVPPLYAFLQSATVANIHLASLNVKSTSIDKQTVSSMTPSIIVDHKKPIISAMV